MLDRIFFLSASPIFFLVNPENNFLSTIRSKSIRDHPCMYDVIPKGKGGGTKIWPFVVTMGRRGVKNLEYWGDVIYG